jgi:biotin transport system ATP-binding protein
VTIIDIDGLTHRYADGTVALQGVGLTIAEGELTVIAGANGSGKTTLLRHLNGLIAVQEGTVRVCGKSVTADPMAARQAVGMVFQDADSQIIGETVYDDVAFGPENLRLTRPEIDRRVHEALSAVGLDGMEDKRPHYLSGGQKRRLAIAGVLAMAPRVLMMDEPFSNLDYPSARQVLKRIVQLNQAGHTIVITTHDLEKIIAHAHRLVVMAQGRIVRDGAPANVMASIEAFGIRPPCSVQLGRGIMPWAS